MTEKIFEKVTGPSHDFQIERGLNPDLMRQLVLKSREPKILETCPKDSAERFSDYEAIERWLKKERQIYPLVNGASLVGVAWYGPKQLPIEVEGDFIPNHTFGIRIYAGYRGRGLAEPFMDETLKDYLWNVAQSPKPFDFEGLWLSVAKKNENARSLYGKYGYQELSRAQDDVFMALSDSKIREITGLRTAGIHIL